MNHAASIARIKELVRILNEAAKTYYQGSGEQMSNLEYDRLYDELQRLEEETGFIAAQSPTQKVGYEVLSELPKERHPAPMLSLNKTKSVEELAAWLGEKEGVLSWKMDGLTVVLTYEKGALKKAVTRGNGEIGEVITQNALQFENVPRRIPFLGRLVLRGEAVISYRDFERINAEIPEADAQYKNPRNLCSGSVRQLDPAVTKKRHVNLIVFSLVSAEERVEAETDGKAADQENPAQTEPLQALRDELPQSRIDAAADANTPGEADARWKPLDFQNSFTRRFEWLSEQGFSVVEHIRTNAAGIAGAVRQFAEKIAENPYPSDGLVLALEDIAYGESLGQTAKFPRNAIAFKWADETAETVLREMEWSASRTGLINPVAIFDPVELEGTTVSRASVHNLSIVEGLKLGIGDRITVYKANMIIPQIAENLTASGTLEIPDRCPVCGGRTEVRQENDAKTLYCTNSDCSAKKLKAFALLASRDALNIDGLSEMTLEKLIAAGLIHRYADLFDLAAHKERIVSMEGFGEKSYANLIAAAERASHTELFRVLYGLGIPGIGLAGAKLICKHFGNEFARIRSAKAEELLEIDGIGAVLAESFVRYFADEKNQAEADALLAKLEIETAEETVSEDGRIAIAVGGEEIRAQAELFRGKIFVITGDVYRFKNRKEVQAAIEALGGKAASAVSGKTSYLINNDSMSGSSKNKKAKELGIPILTEEELIGMLRG